MLEATFSGAAAYEVRSVIECITDIFPETALVGDPGGLVFQGMDTSHVALVSFKVPADRIEKFQCERNVCVGLSMAHLRTAIKGVERDTLSVTLRYDALTASESIEVEIEHSVSRLSVFLILLRTLTPDIADTPSLGYSTRVVMPSTLLLRYCQDLRQFGDTIHIKIDQHVEDDEIVETNLESTHGKTQNGFLDEISCAGPYIEFGGNGDQGCGRLRLVAQAITPHSREFSIVKQEIKKEAEIKNEPEIKREQEIKREHENGEEEIPFPSDDIGIEIIQPVELRFALRFMSSFSKAHKCAKKVVIQLKRDTPCVLQYKTESGSTLTFYLAPNAED